MIKNCLLKLALCTVALTATAGCTRLATQSISAPTALISAPLPTQTPAATTQNARQSTDVASFVSGQALAEMSADEKAEAASAQFYALQFGRPGAPRQWNGDTGASGKVTVGPFVRVNNLDCRDFVHEVTIGQNDHIRRGTSCREIDGSWSVVASS